LGPMYCGPGSDSLTHCDDQLVVPHTWVVDGEPGAAVGSGVGRVAPENVAGCGEQTAMFVGYGWAPTRAPVHKPARKSRSPPRASMHVEALVMTALQVDLADWTGKRRVNGTWLAVAAKKTKNRIGRPPPEAAVCRAKAGRRQGRGAVDAKRVQLRARPPETSALLHSDARCAGRVGRIPVTRQECENRLANLVPKIMASNEIQPIACDALLCAGLAFGGYAKPVLEQVLRSIRKLAAEPTETVGWLRAWAVCAPARHKPPRGGASGERPEERPLLCFDGERCTIFHNENRHTTQITTPMV
jgi:hypothetical protein